MNRIEKFQKEAEVLAFTSTETKKVSCILTNKNKIVAGATNLGRTHPIQAKYAKKAGQPYKVWLHAEIRALITSKESIDTAYVARVNPQGITRNAKPCPICSMALYEAKIKDVYYTDINGVWAHTTTDELIKE